MRWIGIINLRVSRRQGGSPSAIITSQETYYLSRQCSSQNRVLDVSSVEVLEKRIPRTETVILDNIGHAPMYEAPEVSAKHYLEFLQQN